MNKEVPHREFEKKGYGIESQVGYPSYYQLVLGWNLTWTCCHGPWLKWTPSLNLPNSIHTKVEAHLLFTITHMKFPLILLSHNVIASIAMT